MKSTPPHLRAWAEINLGALERNLKQIRQTLPAHIKFISVVKADAYGHGLSPVVTRLMRSEADAFAVANLEEASRIRTVGGGWPILLLSPLLEAEASRAVEMEVIPVVSSLSECLCLNKAAQKQKKTCEIHLKVDTGMGRIGVWWEEALALITEIERLPHLKLRGLCTHFSTADSNPQFTELQRSRFQSIATQLKPADGFLFHADNSAGAENFAGENLVNACRIGLLQFGIRTHPESIFAGMQIEPALSLRCRLTLVKTLPAGTPISYGQTHTLEKSTRIGILSMGYGDGYPIGASNRGKVLIGGEFCQILGRVTMDQIIIDLSSHRQSPKPGETVTLIGQDGQASISTEELAQWGNTIPWQILTGLTDRVTRVYQKDNTV